MSVMLASAPAPETKQDTTAADVKNAYEEFFKGKKCETVTGMMTLHKMDGKLYMEIPEDLLGRDFLLASTVSETSDNFNSVVGSKPFTPLHLKFCKVSDKIRLMNIEKANISRNKGDNVDKALAKSNIDAVFRTYDISVYNADSTAFVIDVTDLFCSDEKMLSPFDPFSLYTAGKNKRTTSFSSENSYIKAIKAFEDNVVVKSLMSYTFSVRSSKKTLIEDQPFSALMTRSLMLLPETPARPRITDSRMSVFPSAVIVYDSESIITKPVYIAHRWRLEPSDTSAFRKGILTEPVRPITFYIDPDFPEEFRPYIKEGVSQWSEAFEKIGFRNAVVALDFPEDDPEFDPDNVKYSCVRYAPTPIENSMGPSWVDPRSGEILSASVYIYHDILKLLGKWLFVQTAQADSRVRTTDIPKEVLGDALRYVVSHEVGHCLGFMHNMSASSVIPVDSLRSPSFTGTYGTTTSIMDYARFNYVAQPGDFEKGVRMTPPRFGVYDYYTVKWNYMPVFDVADMWEEYEVTSGWIHEASSNPVYRYGKQQSTVVDPRSQSEDLGDDAVRASEYGIANLKYILDNLGEWVGKEDRDYSFRRGIYETVQEQYMQYLLHVYANVGGIYLYEKMEGDPVPLYESTPASRQAAAFHFLLRQLDDLEWIDNEPLVSGLGMLERPSDTMRDLLVKMLVSCPEKVELSAVKSKETEPYTPEICLDELCSYVWKPTLHNSVLTSAQKETQRLFIGYLGKGAGIKVNMGEKSEAAYNEPSLAYFVPDNRSPLYYDKFMESYAIVRKAARRSRDKDTRLHYELLEILIEKALK